MSKLISVFGLFLIFSCVNNTSVPKEEIKPKNEGRIVYEYGWHTRVRVFEVDSCEYVGFDAGSEAGTSIIHKQNCKFCAKRNKKDEK